MPLGSSGGSIENIDSGWCCGGTLGALVEDASGNKYILSNNHVLARFNRASVGENVVQPGLIEVGCQQRQGDVVADFTDYVRIKRRGNVVDAAIARIRPGEVRDSGDILDIGTLSTDTLDASPGLLVKKSGRTTGLTSGYVSAVDVSVNVGYTTRCGLPNADFIARFNGQIRITGNSGSFSQPGDSGSVIVEDVANQPRAVGLLFAGSSSSTVANPIDDVLAAFGVTMVGGSTVDPPATGSVSGFVNEAGGGRLLTPSCRSTPVKAI